MTTSSPTFLSLESVEKKQEIIQIIAQSIAETVTNYSKTPATAGTVATDGTVNHKVFDRAGLIRFEGPQFAVEILLCFPSELLEQLFTNTFQDELESVLTESHDLAGELLNVAFGVMDPLLRKMGITLRSSFPKILKGPPVPTQIRRLPKNCFRVPFTALKKEFVGFLLPSGSLQQEWAYTEVKK